MRCLLLMLALVLVGGCATRQTVQTVKPLPLGTVAIATGVPAIGYCVDARWGKCEEHGEWLAIYGFEWTTTNRAEIKAGEAAYDAARAIGKPLLLIPARQLEPVTMLLVCPGPPIHYIEREIKGPEKP